MQRQTSIPLNFENILCHSSIPGKEEYFNIYFLRFSVKPVSRNFSSLGNFLWMIKSPKLFQVVIPCPWLGNSLLLKSLSLRKWQKILSNYCQSKSWSKVKQCKSSLKSTAIGKSDQKPAMLNSQQHRVRPFSSLGWEENISHFCLLFDLTQRKSKLSPMFMTGDRSSTWGNWN